MYLRPEVIVSDWAAVRRFLQEHPLGLLTTAIPLAAQSTLQASHIPFLYDPPAETPAAAEASSSSSSSAAGTWNHGDLGVLRCHLARANPQAKALLSLPSPTSEEVLIVFSDPINSAGYISPQWYTETKPSTHKTVPTWNYAELQIYGIPTILPSPHTTVDDLSNKHEKLYAEKLHKDQVWKLTDAPAKYIELMERAIVAVSIKVTKLGFKVKMSREKSEADRKGVLDGLRSVGGDAAKVADLVERAGPFKKPA